MKYWLLIITTHLHLLSFSQRAMPIEVTPALQTKIMQDVDRDAAVDRVI